MIQYLISMKYILSFYSLNFFVSWTNIQFVKYHHELMSHPMKDDFWSEVWLAMRMPSLPVLFLAVGFLVCYMGYRQFEEMTKN